MENNEEELIYQLTWMGKFVCTVFEYKSAKYYTCNGVAIGKYLVECTLKVVCQTGHWIQTFRCNSFRSLIFCFTLYVQKLSTLSLLTLTK